MFTSAFTNLVITGIETVEEGANIANLLFSMCLVFCGVLASPDALPGFWIWMYRISPFTYLVDGILSTGLANTAVTCSNIEFLHFAPSNGSTCGEYLQDYISMAGGYLLNPEATTDCQFCSVRDTNSLLAGMNLSYKLRWRNFGIMWAFIIFNVCGAFLMYWWIRVSKSKGKEEDVPIIPAGEAPKETGLDGRAASSVNDCSTTSTSGAATLIEDSMEDKTSKSETAQGKFSVDEKAIPGSTDGTTK